jgi:ketosteroid isomerase-like protein
MTDSLKREPILDVIELAMSRLAQKSPGVVVADDLKEQEKLDLGRRDYDMALARRLEKLHAHGNIEHDGSGAHDVAPATQHASAHVPAPERQRPCLRTWTLIIAMLLSIAAGAGATWLGVMATPQPQVVPVAAPGPAAIAAPAPLAVVAPAAVVPATKPDDEEQVRQLVETWRSAWAGRNVEAYLASYGADFTPANGQSRDAWAAARRKNIEGRSSIDVATSHLKLERLDAKRMKVQFLQDYAAGSYRETAQPKTLLLVRSEAGWKIAGEWQGEAPAGTLGKP